MPCCLFRSNHFQPSVTAQNSIISDPDRAAVDVDIRPEARAEKAATALAAASAAASRSAAESAAASAHLVTVSTRVATCASALAGLLGAENASAADKDAASAAAAAAAKALPGVAIAAHSAAMKAAADAKIETMALRGDVARAEIVSIQNYHTFAKNHCLAGKTPSERLVSEAAQRVSDGVQKIASWSNGVAKNCELIGPVVTADRFCTLRMEAAVLIRDATDRAAKLAAAKRVIEPLFETLISHPLHDVCANAELQVKQFTIKHRFWSRVLTLTQEASKKDKILPHEKTTALRYIAAMFQLLLCGSTVLLSQHKIKKSARMGRLCSYISRSALPQSLVLYLRETWRELAGNRSEAEELHYAASIGVTIPIPVQRPRDHSLPAPQVVPAPIANNINGGVPAQAPIHVEAQPQQPALVDQQRPVRFQEDPAEDERMPRRSNRIAQGAQTAGGRR